MALSYLKKGKHVIVDRTNIDPWQRGVWLQIGEKMGVTRVYCVYLNVPPEICKQRILQRMNHPTLPPTLASCIVVDKFLGSFIPPSLEEGFAGLKVVNSNDELENVVDEFAQMPIATNLQENNNA